MTGDDDVHDVHDGTVRSAQPAPTSASPRVAVLCGGVGAARFLGGLVEVLEPGDVTAIVNTGDDTVMHGLHISPDLDTVTYTLAGAIDHERGWGLAGESWAVMEALARYADVRPPSSSAAPTWFNLGDRDLATHCYRTARLAEGATLSDVTAEIAAAWGVAVRLLPMTDARFRTVVSVVGHGELEFQEYFVRLRHSVPVDGVRFAHDGAQLTDAAAAALRDARTVVVAPSNPIVSIGPIRSLPGVDELLASRRDTVVAISPIVGGAAIKGPADRMLTELGHPSSVVGVAELYAPIAATLVIDHADAELAPQVAAAGMRPLVTSTVMALPGVGAALARSVLRVQRS